MSVLRNNFIKSIKIVCVLVQVLFFLNLNVSPVGAIDYGCLRTNGTCQTIAADNFGQAQTACAQTQQGARAILEGCNNFGCLRPDGTCQSITAASQAEGQARCGPNNSFFPRSCNSQLQFGCIDKIGVCRNITALTRDAGIEKCRENHGSDARFQINECLPYKTYGCFIGPNYCTNITANTPEGANIACAPLCQSRAASCYVDLEGPCPATTRTTSLSGVDDLRRSAAETLNVANFNTPQDFIRRAINILMAFIGSITLVLYIVAGLLWMTARGNSEQTDKAKKILVWTTLGVFVMLFSYALVNFLFSSIAQ